MNSVQESKQELQAAIRYAENAISSANATIESMEFRQEMAKKQRSEQKGREQALEAENAKLREDKERLTGLEIQLRDKIGDLEAQSQGHFEDYKVMSARVEGYKQEVGRLKSENIRLKASLEAAEEHIKDMREDLNDQIKLDEDVRQGINDFLNFLDDIDYERP